MARSREADIATVPVASAGEPDDLSYHARYRRKSNTAAEILPEGWYHAGVRPAEHVSLPDWLLDEPDKVAHRDYSTGFYYPEHKVQQSTDRSAYFRAWLVVGEVLSWSERRRPCDHYEPQQNRSRSGKSNSCYRARRRSPNRSRRRIP